MSIVLSFNDPGNMPFNPLEAWPHEDESIASVSIGATISVMIPHANVLSGSQDPLTHIVTEANRVLVQGGTLEISAPYHLCPHGIGHPFQQRIFTEPTWYAFGCPAETEQPISVKDEETGEITSTDIKGPTDPNIHPWGWWHGTHFGVHMELMSMDHDDANWTVFYRKFNDGEYDG